MTSKALNNAFKLNGIVSVNEPRFGVVGDGVTDDYAGITAAIAAAVAAPYNMKLVFDHTKTYAISQAINLAGINSMKVDFNGSSLKAIAAIAACLVVDECSHVDLIKPDINGNALATDGIIYKSSSGVSCAFNNLHEPVVYNCLNSGLRFGDFTISGNDYAIDRTNVYNPRVYQNLYNILVDSINAINVNIYGGSCSKTNTTAANSPKHDVYIKRGNAIVYGVYVVGAMRDDYDSWAYRVDDGWINVYGGYSEAGYGVPNAGQIFMGARVGSDAGQRSNFYGWRCHSRGCATDPVVTDGALVYMANGSNDLKLDGCTLHKLAYAGANVVPVRVHANANFISEGNNYINSPTSPWRGPANTDTIGRITSSGDRSTVDLVTWNDLPEFGYEAQGYVDNSSHNVTGDTNEHDMASVTFPEYFLNNRGGLRVTASGIISGGGVGVKTIKFYFGTTALTMYGAANQYDWHLEVVVFNTDFSAQRIRAVLSHTGGAVITTYATSTQNTGNTLTVKMTGQLTVGTENIGQRMFLVERL